MRSCAQCGTTIVIGGVRDGDHLYCGRECREAGHLAMLVSHLPPEVIDERIRQVHEGLCPRCGGPGPIDVHTAHYIWSAVIVHQSSGASALCCPSCGFKQRFRAIVYCSALGWWSPHGLFLTPLVIMRNILSAVFERREQGPSASLRRLVANEMVIELWGRARAAGRSDQELMSPPPGPGS